MGFVRRVITGALDIANLSRHNANFADIETDLTDQRVRITSAEVELGTQNGRIDNIVVSGGNGNIEVVDAREGYTTLRERLNTEHIAVSEQLVETASELELKATYAELLGGLAPKADRSYVDTLLTSLADGAPKELFYSISSLQSTYPSGAAGPMLVFDGIHTDGAHAYIWNGTVWTDVGLYQSAGLADKVVSVKKIDDEVYKMVTSEYGDYLLPEANVHMPTYVNSAATRAYLIDTPIPPHTIKKITNVNLYCSRTNAHNYIYVLLGYVSEGQITIYSANVFDCVNGVNEFETDIELDVTKTNYIGISGLAAFNTTATAKYWDIADFGPNYTPGNFTTYSYSSTGLTFGLSVQGSSANAEKIYMLQEQVDSWTVPIIKDFSVMTREQFSAPNADWIYANCTASNGLVLNGAANARENKLISIDDYIWSVDFDLNDLASVFGLITLGAWGGRYLLDVPGQRLCVYTNYADTVPAATLALTIPLTAAGRYSLKLIRDGWDYEFVITDLQSYTSQSMHFSNFDNTTIRLYQRGQGYFGVASEAGNVTCLNMTMKINRFPNTKCLLIGDSLTEGDLVSNSIRWARKIKNNYFNGNAIIAGSGGDTTQVVYTKLQNYIANGITCEYCLCLAGMNNRSESGYTAWQTTIDSIYAAIAATGATPIIAIPPIPSTGASYILQMRDYILSKGWYTIRFDQALSVDGYTHNPAYFNTDGVHPNAAGNAAMYDCALKTLKALLT